MDAFQGVEEADQEVHEDGQVEGDVTPQRHVPGAPVQHRLSYRGERKEGEGYFNDIIKQYNTP